MASQINPNYFAPTHTHAEEQAAGNLLGILYMAMDNCIKEDADITHLIDLSFEVTKLLNEFPLYGCDTLEQHEQYCQEEADAYEYQDIDRHQGWGSDEGALYD